LSVNGKASNNPKGSDDITDRIMTRITTNLSASESEARKVLTDDREDIQSDVFYSVQVMALRTSTY